jgi:hypothetical protein
MMRLWGEERSWHRVNGVRGDFELLFRMADTPEMPSLPSVPAGARPVEFVLAHLDGHEYVFFQNIDEARSHPDATMVMEADAGGQILLTCPVKYVLADVTVLARLLSDLETISWGPGFDPDDPGPSVNAAMYFESHARGEVIGGGMGGGEVVDGLWLHPRLDRELFLRKPVEDVLAGRLAQLSLPPKFPNTECSSIEEAQRHPHGRVEIWVDPHNLLLSCRASLVRVHSRELQDLGRAIVDLRRAWYRPIEGGWERRPWTPCVVRERFGYSGPPDADLYLNPDANIEP